MKISPEVDAATASFMKVLHCSMQDRLTEAKLPARWWVLAAINQSDRGKLSRGAVCEVGRAPLDLARVRRAPRAT